MAVTIEIINLTATVKNLIWKCDDAMFERYLNSLVDDRFSHQHIPDPDLAFAVYVVETFGGKIIKATRKRHRTDVIY